MAAMNAEMPGSMAAMDTGAGARARSTDDNLPWVEKYRPKSMNQLVAHEEIISTINALITANKLPHLLFYGPPGTGKTSTIIACAHKLYGKSYGSMVLELNASDDRGIDVVREKIKDFAGTKQMYTNSPKLIVLDEADAMTNPAQMALRRVMEKFTRNARFCLICNYSNKIIPALQSRCTRFRFAPLSTAQATSRTTEIADAEGIDYTPDGIDACVSLGHGDMRRCLNILQSTAMSATRIDRVSVYQCTGKPQPEDVERVMKALLADDFATAFAHVREISLQHGLALIDVVIELHGYVLKLECPSKLPLMVMITALAETEVSSNNNNNNNFSCY